MKETSIFQTIAKNGNPCEREQKGPIFCKDNPWLGDGYYFWDGMLSNAEWWGRTHYKGKYMIFSSSYDAHSEALFDLVGDAKHVAYFQKYAERLMQVLGIKTIKVASVLEFMKEDGKFPFKAVRAEGRSTKGSRKISFVFDDQGIYFLQPVPKFQLCILDFDHFHIADYKFLKASE